MEARLPAEVLREVADKAQRASVGSVQMEDAISALEALDTELRALVDKWDGCVVVPYRQHCTGEAWLTSTANGAVLTSRQQDGPCALQTALLPPATE